jgi:hypothetical protein
VRVTSHGKGKKKKFLQLGGMSHFSDRPTGNSTELVLTAIDRQFSSGPDGNLTTNFEPAFSSLSFKGRKRHTTLMESSAGISRSPDIALIFYMHQIQHKTNYKLFIHFATN